MSTDPQRILLADASVATAIPDVAAQFEHLTLVGPGQAEDLSAVATGSFHGLISQSAPVDSHLLDAVDGLRVVLSLGRNYQQIDAPAVRARGMTLAAVPRKGPNCVAELALTLILALSKDLLNSHVSVAEGAYRLRGMRPELTAERKIAFHWMRHTGVHEITEKTLGIVGMGEIGGELARRAHVLGMRTLYHKRHPLSPELERQFQASSSDLPTLLEESDYVCLIVPHTEATEKLIGREELALMKPTAFLVNVCRGGVVDEDALVEALQNQRIAGAGLDVFTYEPLPADSPLCDLHNVIMTPHIGGGTGTTRAAELTVALAEMSRILAGDKPTIDLT